MPIRPRSQMQGNRHYRNPRVFRDCSMRMCRPIFIPENINTLSDAVEYLHKQIKDEKRWTESKVKATLKRQGFSDPDS